jgi:hypothetical protein
VRDGGRDAVTLSLIPCSLSDANAFVGQHHRHNRPVVQARFSIAATVEDRVVGVAIVGNPVARSLCDGWTLEVVRVATDGTKNACSFLYGAAWRATKALGWRKLITYTRQEEGGASLRAAGWRVVAEVKGRSWSCPSRPRVDRAPLQDKFRWEAA